MRITWICALLKYSPNIVKWARFNQYQYFAIASKKCYTPRLWMMVTCVDKQVCCNFQGTVQYYIQLLRIAVMLYSNFLHLVSSSWTAFVTWHSLQWCYVMVLRCISVSTFRVSNVSSPVRMSNIPGKWHCVMWSSRFFSKCKQHKLHIKSHMRKAAYQN